MIGEKIVATKTDRIWGYVKGDTLEIVRTGEGSVVVARNITRPNLDGYAYLARGEYRYIDDVKEVHVVRLFGIPLLKITKEVE